MKLCVIGNSHVAMLMAALRDAAPADPEVTWFAKPGLEEGEAVLEGSTLCASAPDLKARLDSLGTAACLDLDAFDGVIFVGNTVAGFGAVRLLQGHRVSGWASAGAMVASAADPLAPALKQPLISEPAYIAALTAMVRENLSFKLAAGLRAASDVPICVVPQPFPSEAILEGDRKYPLFRRVARQGDGAALAACMTEAHRRAFSGLPGLVVFAQPEESVTRGFLTSSAFTRDAVRLSQSGTLPQDDVLHAGPALGALYLAHIREAVKSIEKPI